MFQNSKKSNHLKYYIKNMTLPKNKLSEYGTFFSGNKKFNNISEWLNNIQLLEPTSIQVF